MKRAYIIGGAVGLVVGCWRYAPEHCANNDGDCGDAAMFCDRCSAENNGCVDSMPEGTDEHGSCYTPFASGEDSSSSSSTGPSSGGGETMDTTGTLTGVSTEGPTGPECTDNEGCSGAAGFCNEAGECVACDAMVEPDEACAGESAVRPVCEGGVCVQCTTVKASACAGQTPVCGAGNECRGCGEHGECAESACHLDGGQVGACFEETDVVTANSTAELEAAFAGAGTNDNVVVVLTGGNYSGVAIDLLANAEVAVLGDGTVDIVGNRLGGIIGSGGDGIIYFSGVSVAGNVSGSGLLCSATSMWLDDSEVRGNAGGVGIDASGGCAVHLRRSMVTVNNAGGIDISGGELSMVNSVVGLNNGGGIDISGGGLGMVNSVVGLNGNDLTSTVGGIQTDSTMVDITYSVVVGNDAMNPARGSLFCAGGESGYIRNSIVVGDGSSVSGCGVLTLENNAVDMSGLGASNENVGALVPGWFVNLGANDYRLTSMGETAFVGIAQWVEGDPPVDIDGEPIPTDAPSFPGYDQP